MLRFTGCIPIILLLAACEKNIAITIPQSSQGLVVEGYIENRKQPVVILTNSLNYFASMNIDTLTEDNIFVHQARVTVNNGTQTVQLSEKAIDTTGGLKFYMYTIDRSSGDNMTGRAGDTYTLHIEVNGNTYTATTTIPAEGIVLDSLYALRVKPTKENPDTNRAVLVGRFYDPQTPGDCARYFTKRNGEPFYAGLNSVADDEFTNGTVFDIDLDRGQDKNQKIDSKTYGTFALGDTVTLKFCDIDRATYDFWRTWEYAFNSNGNPFSSPVKIIGNIPDAFGYWGGYRAMYQTIIIGQ